MRTLIESTFASFGRTHGNFDMNDPIVDEVRRIRDEHAAGFNYDLHAIYLDLKEQEKASGITFVSFPPRLIEPKAVDSIPSSGAPNGIER